MKHGRRVAVALTAALLGTALTACGRGDTPIDAGVDGVEQDVAVTAYGSPADMPERLEADGTTITVGDPKAPVGVHLYEDPRCPVCEEFESTGGGPVLQSATVRRETRTQYTLASFLDDRLGGSGSKKAVNALRAALDQGRFAEYHDVLYANQPEEAVDGFTDAHLLELADQVEGLRTPAFESAVRTMKYRAFVTASEKAYEKAGGKEEPRGPGTPTAVVNDVRIPEKYNFLLFDAAGFEGFLDAVREAPEDWDEHTLP